VAGTTSKNNCSAIKLNDGNLVSRNEACKFYRMDWNCNCLSLTRQDEVKTQRVPIVIQPHIRWLIAKMLTNTDRDKKVMNKFMVCCRIILKQETTCSRQCFGEDIFFIFSGYCMICCRYRKYCIRQA